MKYHLEYFKEDVTGQEHKKWIPSSDYEFCVNRLLSHMKGGKSKINVFGPAFILTLTALLESLVNDWLIIDTFNKHGRSNYLKIVEGYIKSGLSEKIRIAVAVMTDNVFQVIEDSLIIKQLDKLIAVRNQLTHPKAFFYVEVSKFKVSPKKQRAQDHPLHSLTYGQCKGFMKAVHDYEKKFFDQYDRGFIKANSLLKEIEQIGHKTA
jgi:hypothetical protein